MECGSAEVAEWRDSYRITPEGETSHAADRRMVEGLLARITAAGSGYRHSDPASVTRGMENLKMALRPRLRSGPVDQEVAERIGLALDEAARAVERA